MPKLVNRNGKVAMPPIDAEVDALAHAVSRDRSSIIRQAIIHQAINAYLATHYWQVAHIAEGLRQADAGEFATDAEVAAAHARWR